jgi:hypothetical protein
MDDVTIDAIPVEPEPPERDFAILAALPDAPVLDAGDVLAYLKAAGIDVDGDAVTACADGSVKVAAADDKKLAKAWADYVPPDPPPSPLDALNAVTDLDGIKSWLAANWHG